MRASITCSACSARSSAMPSPASSSRRDEELTRPMPVVVVATGNAGKRAECAAFLGPLGYDVFDLSAIPDAAPVEETGSTVEANARLKAAGDSLYTPHLVVADDSGLEVDALGGAPGV